MADEEPIGDSRADGTGAGGDLAGESIGVWRDEFAGELGALHSTATRPLVPGAGIGTTRGEYTETITIEMDPRQRGSLVGLESAVYQIIQYMAPIGVSFEHARDMLIDRWIPEQQRIGAARRWLNASDIPDDAFEAAADMLEEARGVPGEQAGDFARLAAMLRRMRG